MEGTESAALVERITKRSDDIYERHHHAICCRTDRLFATIMVLQWLAGIAAALFISPRTWVGSTSQTHAHVWAALILGGLISGLPAFLALKRPGAVSTRHIIAIAQALASALLIHLSGGRIETHFHVFGSLAILACYRDWRVLITASVVVALDHAFRGLFWPQSVYGVVSASNWRFAEHVGWVLFESVFLIVSIRQSLREMKSMAEQQAELETTNELVEIEVVRRTAEVKSALTATDEANVRLRTVVQDLEERNRELDEFTYVASHDLQEPIRKLVSFSSLLKQDLGEQLNDPAERDLEYIVNAAERMRDLVQDLLALSRVGQAAINLVELPIEGCVQQAIEVLELRIAETDATISHDELPVVLGDGLMIVQLYQNLISNSLKFMTDSKPVIHLTAERDGDSWILGVKDNGIGMKPEHTERVFAPFQRLHGRTEYDGNGIGLSICKKAVSRHGGNIWVESEVGEGCHFKFSLPASPANEKLRDNLNHCGEMVLNAV